MAIGIGNVRLCGMIHSDQSLTGELREYELKGALAVALFFYFAFPKSKCNLFDTIQYFLRSHSSRVSCEKAWQRGISRQNTHIGLFTVEK